MTSRVPESSSAIRDARRALDGYRGALVTGELLWHDADQNWAFSITLTADVGSADIIAPITTWYVLVEPRYPWGLVHIHPAKNGGIDRTFHHQNHNGDGEPDLPWREGDICVRSPAFALGRSGDDPDPKGDSLRILWYADRAIEWIERAARNALVAPGDDFELPQWDSRPETVGFVEDEATFATWADQTHICGAAELVALGKPFPLAVKRFLDLSANEICAPTWGKVVTDPKEPLRAAWLRLPSVPVIAPYGAPKTWGELFAIMEAAGVRPEEVLPKALLPLRDGKPHVLLLGFPIPRRFGQAPSLLHWQPLQLEVLSWGKKARNGFRATDDGHWKADLVSTFSKKKPITWLTGRNWHASELGTRGLLGAALCARSVLLIGGGALGSAIAELLLRGGVHDLVVVDNDVPTAGNLVRHTLTIREVGIAKATALATRLNAITPHARVQAVVGRFPLTLKSDRELGDAADLIIDCTGSDDVVAGLGAEVRLRASAYLSVSMGRGPKRLYLFFARGTSFPAQSFWDSMTPCIQQDRTEFEGVDFPWEGIGCWHPVFPAPAHVIWLAASNAVRLLNAWISDANAQSGLQTIPLDEQPLSIQNPIQDAIACSA